MGTLEDAAEQLVVKLKGLDAEIEESRHALEEMRGRVETTAKEVDEEWSALTEAVQALFDKVREEAEALAGETQEALDAARATIGAVHEGAAPARSELAEGQGHLLSLARQAEGLDPGMETLVAEAGEAPAEALAQRAHAVHDEVARVLDEARRFVEEDVVAALEQLSADVRDRCQEIETTLAEDSLAALTTAFEDWEEGVSDLEAHVAQQGFEASRSHARAVVEWALAECQEACGTRLDRLGEVVEESVRPLHELAAEVEEAGKVLAADGAELLADLAGTSDSSARAVSALDAVKDLLASFRFVQG